MTHLMMKRLQSAKNWAKHYKIKITNKKGTKQFYLHHAFSFLHKYIPKSNKIGKIVPTKIPIRILSLSLPETKPTRVGPAVQPRSPPRARSAKSAVPPLLIEAEALLKLPGHIIPTERPQSAHPIRPTTLFGTRLIVRYETIHKINLNS